MLQPMFDVPPIPSPSPAELPGDPLPVAIVGAGFSGTITASLLARSAVPVVLIDGSGKAGKGTAYATADPAHLLNVPAGRMSAFADDPDHFLRAIAGEGGAEGSFSQRRRYGAYLQAILDQALASGLVRLRPDRAVGATQTDGAWTVRLESGETVRASALVLATGNQPPSPLAQFADAGPGFIADPWSEQAAQAIAEAASAGGDVLIVGTGLTMVDTVLSLESAGFAGRIVALSRRGLLPQAHAAFDPSPVPFDALPSHSLVSMWRWLRKRSAAVGWRAAVDSLRPHSQALWQGFSDSDQRRFLRHARAWWDVRRHRLAPEVARTIAALEDSGRLEVIAARIEEARTSGRYIDVAFRRRGAAEGESARFSLVINCTGPLDGLSRTRDPLLASLFEQGMIRPDPLDIGLAMAEGSRVAGARRLWALGPLTKGRYWEITAVPDIRGQAANVAAETVEDLKHARTERKERA